MIDFQAVQKKSVKQFKNFVYLYMSIYEEFICLGKNPQEETHTKLLELKLEQYKLKFTVRLHCAKLR